MIAKLTGTVLYKDLKHIIIDTSGVGYKVYCPASVIGQTSTDKTLSIWTYLAVRENALELYGFLTKEELDFFELLISSVSGVGPKSALGILNITNLPSLKRAISSGSTEQLTKVSGIGRKTAEKIILELKDKFEIQDNGEVGDNSESDAIEALEALGYSEKHAREALKKIPKDLGNTGERIKKALKILSGHE